MKALIVCDDDNVIEKITDATTASGYDNIVYRSAMKALDNVEEVSPDVVIFNVCDYPRHWKPFISYSRTFLKKIPEIILFVPKTFSDDEKKKSKTLEVKGIFSNINVDGIYKLKTFISTKKENNAALYGVKILRDIGKENKIETSKISNSFNANRNTEIDSLNTKTENASKTNLSDSKIDSALKVNWFDKKINYEPEIDFFNTKANENVKKDNQSVKSELSSKIEEETKANLFDEKSSNDGIDLFGIKNKNVSETNFLDSKIDAASKLNLADKEIETKKHSDSMMFTHPYSGAFVTGTIKSISDDETLIDFSPDIKIQRLSAGDNINSLSLNTMRGIRSCKAIIERIDDGLITLKVA